MGSVRVGVIDEHEIFRRGLVVSLRDEPGIDVGLDAAEGPVREELDVAVVSSLAVASHRLPCPVVVCARDTRVRDRIAEGNQVAAVLPRSSLTAEQLAAAVRAAAAGLRVGLPSQERSPAPLTQRGIDVLELLAGGADTREIAKALRYSERTIKGVITEIEQQLGARSRAQAVAEGIRLGYI